MNITAKKGGIKVPRKQSKSNSVKRGFNTKSPRYEKGFCRCCLSEGKFEMMEQKSALSYNMSYVDMLQTALGLNLMKAGDTRLICSACAIRLRQAFSFRQQVLAAEKEFLVKKRIAVPREETQVNNEVKTEVIEINDDDETCVSVLEKMLKTSGNINFDIHFSDDSDTDNHNVETDSAHNIETETEDYKVNTNSSYNIESEIGNDKNVADINFMFNGGEKNSTSNQTDSKNNSDVSKKLTCHHCSRQFHSLIEKKEHKKICPRMCPICSEIFQTHRKRNYHVTKIHGNKCKDCQERIPIQHKGRHNFEKHGRNVKCGICERFFSTETELLEHQRIVHMGERDFACSECGFKTFNNSKLKIHMVKHNLEKSYICDYCKKKFLRRSTLTTHIMTHIGLKPKKCKICGEAFVQRASLKYHLEKYHPGQFYRDDM